MHVRTISTAEHFLWKHFCIYLECILCIFIIILILDVEKMWCNVCASYFKFNYLEAEKMEKKICIFIKMGRNISNSFKLGNLTYQNQHW